MPRKTSYAPGGRRCSRQPSPTARRMGTRRPRGPPDARRAGRGRGAEPLPHRARQAAGAALEQAARRFVVISEQGLTGDATEQQLRAARFELERAALRYAATFGWGPPT